MQQMLFLSRLFETLLSSDSQEQDKETGRIGSNRKFPVPPWGTSLYTLYSFVQPRVVVFEPFWSKNGNGILTILDSGNGYGFYRPDLKNGKVRSGNGCWKTTYFGLK